MSASLQNSLQNKKPHPCSQCNKSFSSSHQLAQHSRVHSGEKPYPCAYCERKFKQLSHLQQHTRLHTGERPYKCDCGRSFIQLSNLQQHMKTHESNDSGSRKNAFFCQHCGKSFKQRSSLTVHQNKKHSEQANSFNATTVAASITYVCHVCNNIFLDEASFKNHAEIHQATATINSSTPLTLWTCTICNTFFASETGLQTHLEQTKNDPKHQKNSQIILDKRKMDKKDGDGSLNDLLFTTLISNGKTVNEHDQIVSANLLAQNFLTFNQTQCNASVKPEIDRNNDQNKSNNVNFSKNTNSNTENTNSFVNGNDPFQCQPLS